MSQFDFVAAFTSPGGGIKPPLHQTATLQCKHLFQRLEIREAAPSDGGDAHSLLGRCLFVKATSEELG